MTDHLDIREVLLFLRPLGGTKPETVIWVVMGGLFCRLGWRSGQKYILIKMGSLRSGSALWSINHIVAINYAVKLVATALKSLHTLYLNTFYLVKPDNRMI